MYRYIMACILCCSAIHAELSVTLKNNTKYGVKMVVHHTIGGPSRKRVFSGTSESVGIQGISCAKYIEFKFYNLPDYMHGRPTTWPQDSRLSLKNGKIDGKKLQGFDVDDGKIYYNLGATWGAFYCDDFTLTLDDNGAITLSD